MVDLRSGQRDKQIAWPEGFHATSVACSQGRVALALAAIDKRNPGRIDLLATDSLQHLHTFTAGYHPRHDCIFA